MNASDNHTCEVDESLHCIYAVLLSVTALTSEVVRLDDYLRNVHLMNSIGKIFVIISDRSISSDRILTVYYCHIV